MSDKETLKTFLKEKKILISTNNTTDRTSWKKMFHQMGATVSNITNADRYDEAIDILNTKLVHIVMTSYEFENQKTMKFLDLHNEKYPDRSNYLFFMVSDKNSLAVAACAAEHEIDTMLIKPYNLQDLDQQITKSILNKAKINPTTKSYFQIKADLAQENFDKANDKIEALLKSKPKEAISHFLKGLYYKKTAKFEEAIECWKSALEIDPLHHQSLCHIFDTHIDLKLFIDAYPYAEILCEKYPINPERIPNFIRVSLATENYQNLIDFCDMILEVESNLEEIKRPIAAALAVCGKNLTGNDDHYELVKSSALMAMSLTEHTSQIFITCIKNLIGCGDLKTAQTKIDEIPTDEMSKDLFFLEFKISYLANKKPHLTFSKGQNLLKLDYKSSELYELLINTCVTIEKNKDYIEELIFDACKLYPSEEEKFKSFLN